MPDIFDEVEEDLRAERARALGRRYAGTVIALLVLILVGTGAYVTWQQHAQARADAVAEKFIAAAKQADHVLAGPPMDKPDAEAAQAGSSLADIAATGPDGYRVLARLRLAALQWQTGQQAQAVASWQVVSDDSRAPALLRDLATLTSAQHQADTGNPAVLKQRLQSLTAPDNPWRSMADQVIALIDLRTGHTREAAGIMRRLSTERDVPEGVRGMAADLLTTLPATDTAEPASGTAATPHK